MVHLSQASAIGIIGGADGPTAIYVSGPAGLSLPAALLLSILLTVAGVAVIFAVLHRRERARKKKERAKNEGRQAK